MYFFSFLSQSQVLSCFGVLRLTLIVRHKMNDINIAEIYRFFDDEFIQIKDKFVIYNLSLEEAEYSNEPHIWKSGVYVFWHPERKVIKVGRHLTNSRKRAFEHIKGNVNTGGTMAELKNQKETRLLLFNVIQPKDKHWVAALEIFFEEILNPQIKSGRLG